MSPDDKFYFSVEGFTRTLVVRGDIMKVGEQEYDMEKLFSRCSDPEITHWFDLVNSIFDGAAIVQESMVFLASRLVGDHTIQVEFPNYSIRLQDSTCYIHGRTQKLNENQKIFRKRNWPWISQLMMMIT